MRIHSNCIAKHELQRRHGEDDVHRGDDERGRSYIFKTAGRQKERYLAVVNSRRLGFENTRLLAWEGDCVQHGRSFRARFSTMEAWAPPSNSLLASRTMSPEI